MSAPEHFLGLDAGAETLKAVLLRDGGGEPALVWCLQRPHGQRPAALLPELNRRIAGCRISAAAVTGRLASRIALAAVPHPRALAAGFRFCHPRVNPATLLVLGSHDALALEMHADGRLLCRRNGRCSQGTGNFLHQLTGRLDLSVDQADALCAAERKPLPLSGRCPVILKTDMTHLANSGAARTAVLAGLFDAVAEQAELLIKPGAPARVYLSGGVSRSRRIRDHLRRFLEDRGSALEIVPDDQHPYYAAIGAALEARRTGNAESFAGLFAAAAACNGFERLPPLSRFLPRVRYLTHPPARAQCASTGYVLGLDIGSTGAKAVAYDPRNRAVLWSAFRLTRGDPLSAARALVGELCSAHLTTGGRQPLLAVGVTGSGRAIVGAALRACFGPERIFVLNEIAAHAEGALYYDRGVDTIFEIGGQDAKYIRLRDGCVVESAMNQACSAGTGSFIEEQGCRLADVPVAELSREALAAPEGLSLGQHCSVFMAETIEKALAGGEPVAAVVAGIYDSVAQNYLNRVKGRRPVGDRIFCQGMPFAAPALAAAIARRTGKAVIVPPCPGLTGALGIALLTARERTLSAGDGPDPSSFARVRVLRSETFVCRATRGCAPPGNRCRVRRIAMDLDGCERIGIWGGSCSLHEGSAASVFTPLAAAAPDPMAERRALLEEISRTVTRSRGRPRIALSRDLLDGGLFPFFSLFLRELGFDPLLPAAAGQEHLRKGMEVAPVALCAPLHLYAGMLDALCRDGPEHLFLPMLRDLPPAAGVSRATLCPLSQSTGDLFGGLVARHAGTALHRPVFDMGPEGLASRRFADCARAAARELGVRSERVFRRALEAGRRGQEDFLSALEAAGARALDYAAEHRLPTVVLLGRPYTLYHRVLNAGVPALLRELGAMAVPLDCLAVSDDVPVFKKVYWGYSQNVLRAACQAARSAGTLAVFCSNYGCGPDSFTLHFAARLLGETPLCVIETDGHTGDAGVRTRLEAFLYCAASAPPAAQRAAHSARVLVDEPRSFAEVRRRGETLLIPPMGQSAPVLAAAFRGAGLRALALAPTDGAALALGRRHTSGKECLPAILTLGALLRHLERADPAERFAFFMPTADGPCRFGMYHLLHRLVLESLPDRDRVQIVAPHSAAYFEGLSPALGLTIFAGFTAGDLLLACLLDTRPVEASAGAAEAVYARWRQRLLELLEQGPPPGLAGGLAALAADGLGLAPLLRAAAREFAALRNGRSDPPTVALVGEIYVRLDPFANDFVIRKLESRGLRVRLAPFTEWIEYVDVAHALERRRGRPAPRGSRLARHLPPAIRRLVMERLHGVVAPTMGWARRLSAADAVRAAAPYVRPELLGEAVLTVGVPVRQACAGEIAGAVSVGPLECMPNKIAEARFASIERDYRLPTLTLSLSGDPMDEEALDAFAYEVKARSASRSSAQVAPARSASATSARSAMAFLTAVPGEVSPSRIAPDRTPSRTRK